jgi:hypothetical protein
MPPAAPRRARGGEPSKEAARGRGALRFAPAFMPAGSGSTAEAALPSPSPGAEISPPYARRIAATFEGSFAAYLAIPEPFALPASSSFPVVPPRREEPGLAHGPPGRRGRRGSWRVLVELHPGSHEDGQPWAIDRLPRLTRREPAYTLARTGCQPLLRIRTKVHPCFPSSEPCTLSWMSFFHPKP